jgi:hypothetical protein
MAVRAVTAWYATLARPAALPVTRLSKGGSRRAGNTSGRNIPSQPQDGNDGLLIRPQAGLRPPRSQADQRSHNGDRGRQHEQVKPGPERLTAETSPVARDQVAGDH